MPMCPAKENFIFSESHKVANLSASGHAGQSPVLFRCGSHDKVRESVILLTIQVKGKSIGLV